MRRRGYLVLVGATAIAGCQSEGGSGSDPPTATETDTSAATETPEPEETDAATPDETGPLADARSSIRRGHEAYRDTGGADAQTLRDVDPATTEFPTETVLTAFDEADSRLAEAEASASGDLQARIDSLRQATQWLRGAAQVQSAASDVAAAVEQAATTGNFGADYGTLVDHVTAAGDATDRVLTAIADLQDPDRQAFEELAFVDGATVGEKHDGFVAQRPGYQTLSEVFAATIAAGDLIDEATTAADAGDDERAKQRATTAVDELSTVLDQTEDVDHERLVPLAERVRDALESLRARADGVRNDAQNSQT